MVTPHAQPEPNPFLGDDDEHKIPCIVCLQIAWAHCLGLAQTNGDAGAAQILYHAADHLGEQQRLYFLDHSWPQF